MQSTESRGIHKNVTGISHSTGINGELLVDLFSQLLKEVKNKKVTVGENPIGNALLNGQIIILERLIIGLVKLLDQHKNEERVDMEKVKNLVESVVKLEDLEFRRSDSGLAASLDNALSRIKSPGDAVILTTVDDKEKRTLDLRLGKLRKAKKIDDRIRLRKTSKGQYCIVFLNS